MNVAIVQAHLEWENVPVNLKLFNKRIAAIEGANVIVLPEMFASGKGHQQTVVVMLVFKKMR